MAGFGANKGLVTQSGSIELFGPCPEQWSVDELRRFMAELQRLWDGWR